MALARCSAETELETLHTARNHLFACGAACRGQEMAELRRQALASVIDSAPFAFGARVLVQMPAIPSGTSCSDSLSEFRGEPEKSISPLKSVEIGLTAVA